MKQRRTFRKLSATLFTAMSVLAACLGLTCPGGDGTASLDPAMIIGNRAPRLQITNVQTPTGDNNAEQGDVVTISFAAEDSDDAATVRIFAATTPNPTAAEEVPIADDIVIGPGTAAGLVQWDTAIVSPDSYSIFGEIDDGTFDAATGMGNPPVRVTYTTEIVVAPQGTAPLPTPPAMVFVDPQANLGLSVQDEVTIRYLYTSPTGSVTVTLLLDRDLDPTNDSINAPGDPLDPNTNIIILPSTPRLPNDPTFDGDPPPPDDANNPPAQPDSIEIRTNPRTLDPTLFVEEKEYRFVIDFTQIPISVTPLFVRATFTDGNTTQHVYAIGSVTISGLATGTVDAKELGFRLAGARFQGFSAGEYLGSDFIGAGDLDFDGNAECMISARYARPRGREWGGAGYLIYGRRKTPFPPDTNGNGLPDLPGQGGAVLDFPVPPAYLPDPYDSANVGRFGGTISINSVGGAFFRGTMFAMPEAHNSATVPPALAEANHGGAHSAGLTSIARLDMTADGVPDWVFGLPFVASAYDYHDDDPADGCDNPYGGMPIPDDRPNFNRCTEFTVDSMITPGNPPVSGGLAVDQGMVIVVDGTNDLANAFDRFLDANLAGQHNPLDATDDEGVAYGPGDVPIGMRFRGGWFDSEEFAPPYYSDSEFGRTVAAMPSFDNDAGDELLLSTPAYDPHGGFEVDGSPAPFNGSDENRGRVQIWLSTNYLAEGNYEDDVLSLPSYMQCPTGTCVPDSEPTECQRCLVPLPNHNAILGQEIGDRFGFASSAGDFNQDGTPDILAGAPGADRNGLTDAGVVYVLAVPNGGLGDVDMGTHPLPRLEIIGSHNDDRFGEVQTAVQDINGDGIEDVAFASEFYDESLLKPNVGYVGVIFGDRPITGEQGFSPEEVGTPLLPGIRFLGVTTEARAGRDIASAGDFNGDGIGDLLISSPGEVRLQGGEQRLGVAYLVFGGPHLTNKSFNLSQVGSQQLPGIVFVSRFPKDTIDQAPIETVGGLGDIDGDGFDDIAIGCPTADFVNPNSPNQRRINTGEVNIVYGSNFGSNRVTP